LILDEPTNHLDIPAREALEAALAEYDGTIITVSHDRFFLDKIATQILAFEEDGSVDAYPGNYTEYHDWKQKAETRAVANVPFEETSASAKGRSNINRTETLSKNQRTQTENRIKKIENQIADLEKQLARLATEMSDPKIAGDFEKLNSVTLRHSEIDSKIRSLYAEWDTLTSQLER
jgi:ATP-binding cassette subfamily F protein 3